MKPELNTLLLLEEKEARIAELKAGNTRFREALQQIAKEKRPEEYQHSEWQIQDFEGLFDASICIARQALARDGKEES